MVPREKGKTPCTGAAPPANLRGRVGRPAMVKVPNDPDAKRKAERPRSSSKGDPLAGKHLPEQRGGLMCRSLAIPPPAPVVPAPPLLLHCCSNSCPSCSSPSSSSSPSSPSYPDCFCCGCWAGMVLLYQCPLTGVARTMGLPPWVPAGRGNTVCPILRDYSLA